MKIAILTSGILPVPAVQGGAVENLIDYCLEYNERHSLHEIMVFSVNHPEVKGHPALRSRVNTYFYIDTTSFIARIRKRIFKFFHPNHNYYNYSIEYFLSEAIKVIQRQQFDLVLIENRPGYVLRLKDITNARFVIHQENDYLNANTKYGKEIYENTYCIINTSDYITRQIRTINPNDNKSKTVLNGISTTSFFDAKSYSRLDYGFHYNNFIIVFSGRLTKDKGILQLIQAIKQIQVISNIKLMVLGASAYGKDSHITPFIKQLEEEAAPIKENVFFTGYINYNQVPSYLKMADIAVIPSMWEEPFGLTVVEAMAAGLPLITTRSGGIPEICDGVATIVERDDIVNNLAQAILDLYEHPEKRKQMAAASLKRAKLFDKETYAKNFFEALEELNKK